MVSTPRSPLRQWWEHAALQPDLSRAVRATVAFMAPLLLALHGGFPVDVSFTAITAQNLAMVDIRGDYRVRLGLLLAMTAVFVGAAALGTAVAHDLSLALAATALVAVASSAWRHLSPDYGAGLAIASTFVFVFALATPAGKPAVLDHTMATLIGGVWGIVVQVAAWPFRPQHPLRRAASDSWVAVAELFDCLTEASAAEIQVQHARMMEKEAALRTALDAASDVLTSARQDGFIPKLQAVNMAAARLAMRVAALNTALESLRREPEFAVIGPALDPLLSNLSNLSRSVAVAVVSRQPAHFVNFEVRLRRAAALLPVARTRIAMHAVDKSVAAHVTEILAQIEAHLPAIHDAVRATITRADERAAVSLELLDLRSMALRPLASALNLTWTIDPVLVRFTARTAILTMLGVVVFKLLRLPHGYWLPFTVVVVLQPDYGSTRQRAAQRVLGTLVGAVLGSLLLWLHLSLATMMVAAAATIFIFGYWLKRNYGIAVVFITLFVVLLTEAFEPVTLELTFERLASTFAGGMLALLAAQLFWPVWERDRFPPLLASAFRANSDYLAVLAARVMAGGGFDAQALAAKRRAERANTTVFSSLTRLNGEPKNQREGLELFATLANGNQRVTRALNVLALHLTPDARWHDPALGRFVTLTDRALGVLATATEAGTAQFGDAAELLRLLEADPLPVPPANAPRAQWAFRQFNQIATELAALLVVCGKLLHTAAPAVTITATTREPGSPQRR